MPDRNFCRASASTLWSCTRRYAIYEMMKRSVSQFLLTCLLLVALPFKGWAVTSMVACGPNHHSVSQASTHDVAHDFGAHGHDHRAAHPHPVEQSFASSTSAFLDEATSKSTQEPEAGKLQCNGCAPCCAGAAVTNTPMAQLPAPAPGADYPALSMPSPSAPSSRLERPPRIILA